MKIARAYLDSRDLQAMLALQNLVRPVNQLKDYPSSTDLHELLQFESVRANTRLWFEDETLFAFALMDEYSNIFFDCAPNQLDLIGAEIIEWGLSRLSGEAKTLDTNCRASDSARISFLEQHGFKRTPNETIFLCRDLTLPLPQPVLPDGFVIRPLNMNEAAQAAELHRLAFGTDHVTTEVRLSWMRTPAYDPSLDLIAVAPDGTFAAYCLCSIDHERNRKTGRLEGQTDPVATHPRYQRLGLARALLLTGMTLLKERGMTIALLGTSDDNIAMQKSAVAVGFQVDHKKIWFEREKNNL